MPTVLALVGCVSTSPSIPDIYLVRLEDTKTNATVRIGYFGKTNAPTFPPPFCPLRI